MNPINKIQDYLDGGKKWIQGTMHARTGPDGTVHLMGAASGRTQPERVEQSCLLGAVQMSHEIDAAFDWFGDPFHSVFCMETWPGVEVMAKVIREQFADRVLEKTPWANDVDEIDADSVVMTFNDHQATTWEEVERVLEKAALLYEETA